MLFYRSPLLTDSDFIRISELLKKQVKKRQAKNRQVGHGKGIKENIPLNNMAKPTLPSVDLYHEEKHIPGSPYQAHARTPNMGYFEPPYGVMSPPVGRRGSNSSMGSDMTGLNHSQRMHHSPGWQQSHQPRYETPPNPPHHSPSPYMEHYQVQDPYSEADHSALLQHAADPYGRRPSGESATGSEQYYSSRQQDYFNPHYRNMPRNPGEFIPPQSRPDSPVHGSPRTSPANVHQIPPRYQDHGQYYQQQQQHNYRGY